MCERPLHPWNFLYNSNQLESRKNSIENYKIRICINDFSYKNLNDELGAGSLLYKSVQNLMLVKGYILNFRYCEYFCPKWIILCNDLKY